MRPMFTIGIASYNYASYMTKGLTAIKNQTYQDYEIIISDDASTDNSVEVIEAFVTDNPQLDITFIKKDKNEGLVANKNTIIEHANGKYLLICDADDWMDERCLEKIAQVADAEDPDRIIVNVAHIDGNGKIIQVENIPEKQTRWGWSLHHGSACKVDIIREHNIKITGEPDDIFFTLEFAKYAPKLSCIRETLYYWLMHRDSEGRKKIDISDEYFESFYINELNYIADVLEYIKEHQFSERDIEELRYSFLKWYYFAILFAFQQISLHDKLKYYGRLHSRMIEIDPHYLNNTFTGVGSDKILRPYASKAINLCVKLEKMKMMKLALCFYHLVSRVKYFDQ